MMRLRLNWIAFVVLVGSVTCLGLTGCRGSVSSRPPIHLNPNMDNQAYLQPQEPSSFFRDKRGMRPLVKGTVARGFLRADEHFYAGKVKGKYVKTLPKQIKLTKALLARGQERYNIYCAPCHGFQGDGKGVVTYYSRAINPANLHDDLRRSHPPGKIYDLIANGKMSGKQIAMPSYRSQLSVKDWFGVVCCTQSKCSGHHWYGHADGVHTTRTARQFNHRRS